MLKRYFFTFLRSKQLHENTNSTNEHEEYNSISFLDTKEIDDNTLKNERYFITTKNEINTIYKYSFHRFDGRILS